MINRQCQSEHQQSNEKEFNFHSMTIHHKEIPLGMSTCFFVRSLHLSNCAKNSSINVTVALLL